MMQSIIRTIFSRLSSVRLPQLPRIEADDAVVAADGGRGQALPRQALERRRDRLRERLEFFTSAIFSRLVAPKTL